MAAEGAQNTKKNASRRAPKAIKFCVLSLMGNRMRARARAWARARARARKIIRPSRSCRIWRKICVGLSVIAALWAPFRICCQPQTLWIDTPRVDTPRVSLASPRKAPITTYLASSFPAVNGVQFL